MDDTRQYTLVGVTVTPTHLLVDGTDEDGNEVEFAFEFENYPHGSMYAAAAAGLATRAAEEAAVAERAAKL